MKGVEARAWVERELLDLVAIASPSEREHDAVDHLEARCAVWGLPAARLGVEGTADDLVIGWSARPHLLLTAHIDTVVPAWSWSPSSDGVRVRGLGAADCKGALIAFALGTLLAGERGVDLASLSVALGVCVDEESLGRGSIAMAGEMRPRYVVAGEPTRLQIGVAEAGFVDAIARVRGRSAHGSLPERGDNAIEKAARLILAVHEEPFTRSEHPLLGRNIPGALWIEGGGELHVVPDRVGMRIEIRVVPGGPSAAEIEARFRELAREHDADLELLEPSVEPFETDAGGPLVQALAAAAEQAGGGRSPVIGIPAWTDAHNFVELAGAQAVVWGPGDFTLAHVPDEAIEIDEVVAAARVVEELLVGAAGWVA
jgi:acetylornithine deacetylase/succinyl-diaminopimelate desuccinylase-like protein